MRFDWLMRVHYNAVLHCGLRDCLGVSVPPPASALLFSKKYKQNYRAFKIQIFSRRINRLEEQSNFISSFTYKLNQLGIRRICFSRGPV
jgi:hypothetical protein